MSALVVEAVRPTALDLVADLTHLGFAKALAAESAQEALDVAAADKPDVVLTDVNLAHPDEGFDLAARLGAEHNLAVVFFSTEPEDRVLQQTLAAFSCGFFASPFNPEEMRRAIKLSLASHARGGAATLADLRVTDPLTGLGNARKLQRCLDHEWRRCERDAVPLAVLAVEIDGFAAFEDEREPGKADRALVDAAQVLDSQCYRRRDTLLRIAGAKFMAVLPATDAVGARHVAGQVLEAFRAMRAERPTAFPLTVSVGIAVAVPGEDEQPSGLVRKAEFSLESAKKEGGNRTVGGYVPPAGTTSPVVSTWLKSILRQKNEDANRERRRIG